MVAAVAFGILVISSAMAHGVVTAVADMELHGSELAFRIEMNAEDVVARINLSGLADTNDAPEAASYDALRALPPDTFAARFTAFRPTMAAGIRVSADGQDLAPVNMSIMVPPVGDTEVNRPSKLRFSAPVPSGSEGVILPGTRVLELWSCASRAWKSPITAIWRPAAPATRSRLAVADRSDNGRPFWTISRRI